VNRGGDNVHRTAVLGMLMGAGCDELPTEFMAGLVETDALAREIDEFTSIAL